MTKRAMAANVVLAVLVSMISMGSGFADTKVVDPSGGGDYTTIQAAVNGLPDPGPRTAIDRGVNTFSDGSTTWLIIEDLEGHPRPQDGDGDCFAIADAGCYEAPAVSCQGDAVPSLARLLLGDGSGLISNVNANTLGGIPATGYATTIGSYPSMNVGMATFVVIFDYGAYVIRATNSGIIIISDGANWLVKGVF